MENHFFTGLGANRPRLNERMGSGIAIMHAIAQSYRHATLPAI
jgi:hypothetical protein